MNDHTTAANNRRFPNRPVVFIATLGNAPQVVTLALDQLIGRYPFVEVCVIHTDDRPEPAREAKGLPTMHETVGRLDQEFTSRRQIETPPGEQAWEADYPIEGGRHRLTYRRVLIRRQEQQPGQLATYAPVRDVETEENSRAAFRTIYQVVRRYKEQRAMVHLSVAGGRKSMSVFGMATAQLLFGPGDKVWHVVSRDEFMNTQAMHDTRDQSRLVPIPFVRLSAASPVLGMLLSSSDPYDAIQAQENFLQLIDVQRKEKFLQALDADERQILVGVAQGLNNAEIGRRLEKPLAASTIANKLTAIYETYLVSITETPMDVTQRDNENMRVFLAAEFGAYFQQRGERLQ